MKHISFFLLFLISFMSFSQETSNNTIILKDSTVYLGRITKVIPGQSISIETFENQIIIIDMDDVLETSYEKEYKPEGIRKVDAEETIGQGTVYVHGGSNYTLIHLDYYSVNQEVTQNYFEAVAGLFLYEKTMVGFIYNYSSVKFKNELNSMTSYGPLVRLYNNQVFLGAAYVIVNQKGMESFSGWSLEFGYAVFISKHITIEPSIGYVTQKDQYNTLGFNLSFGVYF